MVLRLRFTAAVDTALGAAPKDSVQQADAAVAGAAVDPSRLQVVHTQLTKEVIPGLVSAIGQVPAEPVCGRLAALLAEVISQSQHVQQLSESETATDDWSLALRYYWEEPDQLLVRSGKTEVPFQFVYHNRQPQVQSADTRQAASTAMGAMNGAMWVEGGASAVSALQMLAQDLGRIALVLPCLRF